MIDIRKVEPVHGWREFLGEVGIIVLGVLIALGFEQLVTFVSGQMLFFVEKAGMMPSADLVRSAVYQNSGTIAFCRAHRLGPDHARSTQLQLVRHGK